MFFKTMCSLKLKESERTIENEQQTIETLNTESETQRYHDL